jgi:6-pyruvoyltetrahydropterin/6-carboxytetrahydropterin synthase
LEVTVSGQVDPSTGMVCNLVDLDGCVRREVLDRFDHQNLNELQEFSSRVPTTENLADCIYNILKQSFNSAHLDKVRIEETSNNSFEYCGEAAPLR